MILYNVTVKIDHDVHDEWLGWMREHHIPDVMATGLFTENQICKLLEEDESDGFTYAIQYTCRNMNDYLTYQREHAPALQEEHTLKYQNKFVAFRTLLRVLT